MITKSPFLSPDETSEYRKRLFQNLSFGNRSGESYIFGPGILHSPDKKQEYSERVNVHNTFMRSVFPELLEKLQKHFKAALGKPCFYADELSYPGFHIFRIHPGMMRPLWFHYDDTRSIFERDYPQYGVQCSDIRRIEGGSRHITFTCLIDQPEGLLAGLLYFPQNTLGHKVASVEVSQHGQFEDLAIFQQYSLGEMNMYERVVHSVYGRNDSSAVADRVTIQGYLVETSKGFVIFR